MATIDNRTNIQVIEVLSRKPGEIDMKAENVMLTDTPSLPILHYAERVRPVDYSDGVSGKDDYSSNRIPSLVEFNGCLWRHVGNMLLSSSSSASFISGSTYVGSPKTQKKTLNFLQKLHIREIRGCFQVHQHSGQLTLFHGLPERLKFPLHELIQYSDFTDGHIFLGFTKDGQFVISYAMQMELVLYPLPTYTYTLYFWRFIPHKPLKKVSEIQLFRKYEIQSELLISVCQWPLDNSKILVHGFSPLGDQEHRTVQNPCYLTIAAIPPIQTCQECKASIYTFDADDEDEEWDNRQAACLTHGFVLHVQYDLVPPFPKFNPRVSLTKDGRVVINTGDSLIALSITTDCQEDVLSLQRSSAPEGLRDIGNAEPLPSPGLSESGDGSTTGGSSPAGGATAVSFFDQHANVRAHYSVDPPRSFTWKSTGSPSADCDRSSPASIAAQVMSATAGDFSVSIDGHYATTAGVSTPDSSSNAASASSSPVIELFASPVRKIRHHHKLFSSSAANECEPVYDGGRSCDISSEVTHTEWEFAEEGGPERVGAGCPLHSYSRKVPIPMDDTGHHRLATSFVNSQNLGRTSTGFGSQRDRRSSGGGGHTDESVKENLSPAMTDLLLSPALRHLGKTVLSEGNGGGKPSDSVPRPTSPDGGPLVAHSTPGCVVRVNQVFVPCIDILLMEGEDEDVGNSAYQNSLSLAVYWPSSTPLIPCPTRLLEDVKGPVLVVKQAIFDVEQYLHEMAQRLCSEAGQKYQAFTDYDIQILDVFEETSDVLALAVMLIQAAPKNKGLIKSHRNSSGVTRKQYETGFKFLWNIQTGKCQIVDTEILREDNTKVASYQRSWNPGRKKCTLLQQKWSHPCATTQEVLVSTNEPVFAGVPIDIFYSPCGDVAIERANLGGPS